jgi:hypothetical protein
MAFRLKVLIGCEFSGIVREAFTRLGHDATSCDFLPTEIPGKHYQGDVMNIVNEGWDLAIFHPPCTYLSASGLHWNKRQPERARKTEESLAFVRSLLNLPIPAIALENPVGCISSAIRKPDQILQPYNFGDDASKQTCLWLKNLHPLKTKPEQRIPGRKVMWKGKLVERWSNQCDSGQSNLPPSEDRWAMRSRTYVGIAEAMAMQWGGRVNTKPSVTLSTSISL